MKSLLFLSLLFISNGIVQAQTPSLLIELCRYGASREKQTPNFVSDPYPEPETGLGDLTNVGYRQQYLLGKAISKEFDEIFPLTFDYKNVVAFASNKNNTLQSANSQLFGIFDVGSGIDIENDDPFYYNPPIEKIEKMDFKEAVPEKLAFIPVLTQALKKDTFFQADQDCPVLKYKLDKSVGSLLNKHRDDFTKLYKALKEQGYDSKIYTGSDNYDIKGAQLVCDIIISQSYSDSEFKQEDLMTQCEFLMNFVNFVKVSDPILRNTIVSELHTEFKNIIANWKDKKNEALKFALFVGNELNMAGLVSLFQEKSYELVLEAYKKKYNKLEKLQKIDGEILNLGYTSSLVLSVSPYKGGSVQLYFNNEIINVNDSHLIPIEDFLKTLESSIDPKFIENCGIEKEERKNGGGYFVSWFITLLIVLVLGFIYYRMVEKKKEENNLAENQETLLY